MNTSMPDLAVTGSTGVLGRLVAGLVANAAVPQRLLVRTPAKAPQLPGATVHPFSYEDREASVLALAGAATLFMVSAPESEGRLGQHRAFIDAASDAGVRHVVYTSFLGAAPDATFTLAREHHATEEYIKSSGMDWTFLRDSLYIDFMDALVGDDGVIRGPAGSGRAAIVARADIAAVAAAVVLNPEAHRNASYDLTGPESLRMDDVATILSASRGSTVTFHDETLPEAYASREKWGAPDWQVDAWVSTYTAIASGELAVVTGNVEMITGRRPTSLAEFLAGSVG